VCACVREREGERENERGDITSGYLSCSSLVLSSRTCLSVLMSHTASFGLSLYLSTVLMVHGRDTTRIKATNFDAWRCDVGCKIVKIRAG
jgi:hypothetical protein